jgi:glycosyltransferase involved in cell wall biosynthesis
MSRRVAWFTPLPPVRSGISAYSVEVLPRLGALYDIDVFVDDAIASQADGRWAAPDRVRGSRVGDAGDSGYTVRRAHDFQWRHIRRPYDVIVYQLGNAPCHDYMWPYLVRFPGLVVLHDAQLLHARARALLSRGRRDDYREEFSFNHPDVDPAAAEYVVAGFTGAIYYLWPMLRVVMTAARAVAVHSAPLADDLREAFCETSILHVRMGVRDPQEGRSAEWARSTPGQAEGRVRFAAFGLITPEKRIPQVLRALAAVVPYAANAELVLVGDTVGHYDVASDIDDLGLSGRVRLAGRVSDAGLDREMASADAAICLRWPSAGETSASWLRCLAAGLPTIVTDLVSTVDVPSLDPRSWTLLDGNVGAEPARPERAVAISIDILDEDHSLRLAMRRLARDPALRQTLGSNARAHWAAHHTLDVMTHDYVRALEHTTDAAPHPGRASLPRHLLADGTGLAQEILGRMGLAIDDLVS